MLLPTVIHVIPAQRPIPRPSHLALSNRKKAEKYGGDTDIRGAAVVFATPRSRISTFPDEYLPPEEDN